MGWLDKIKRKKDEPTHSPTTSQVCYPYGQNPQDQGYGQQKQENSAPAHQAPQSQPQWLQQSQEGKQALAEHRCGFCGRGVSLEGETCSECMKDPFVVVQLTIRSAKSHGGDTSKAEREYEDARNARMMGEAQRADGLLQIAYNSAIEAESAAILRRASDEVYSLKATIDLMKMTGVDTKNAENLLVQAKHFLDSGDYRKAIAMAEQGKSDLKMREDRQDAKVAPASAAPVSIQAASRANAMTEDKPHDVQTAEPSQKCDVSMDASRPSVPVADVKNEQKEAAREEKNDEQAQSSIDSNERLIKSIESSGTDVSQAMTMLRLAKSFARSKSYDKAIEYAEKATKLAREQAEKKDQK